MSDSLKYSIQSRGSVTAPAGQASSSKGAQTRQSILAAAVSRFGRDGFRSTSVADIARDAGVGGTVAYAYFPNKEALFLAAVDEDAAAVIGEGLATAMEVPDIRRWHDTLIFTLVDAVERHPLARRLLAGLEPDATARVLEIPPSTNCARSARSGSGPARRPVLVRPDIDAATVGNGVVALMLSVLDVGDPAREPDGHDLLPRRGGGVRGRADGAGQRGWARPPSDQPGPWRRARPRAVS